LLDFLISRGIRHIVALQYAHKPGMAEDLNRYMETIVRRRKTVTGLATVFPGEAHARTIMDKAFQNGLRGIKLHSHVQCFEMDSPGMHEVYRCCCDHDVPLVIHAGREPKSPAYPCDPYKICHWTHVRKVLEAYPSLKLVVPHMGADEFTAYRSLLEQYDHLWLDTTMVLADYLPMDAMPDISAIREDRLMFGTDFPNIPYAWDRELRRLADMNLKHDVFQKILSKNAVELFQIRLDSHP
jgi:predicted TIM-barrel fold metal-dependent hydrolase